MANSCIWTKRRYTLQLGTVIRMNSLKTRFINKYKKCGIVKGKIQDLAGVSDIRSTVQGGD